MYSHVPRALRSVDDTHYMGQLPAWFSYTARLHRSAPSPASLGNSGAGGSREESLSPKPSHASKQKAAVPRQSCCRAVRTQAGARRSRNRVRVTVPKLPDIPSTGKGRDPGCRLLPPAPSEFPVSLEQVVHQLLLKYPLEGAGLALSDRLEPSPKGCNKKCPNSREHEWIPAAPAVTGLPPLPAAWLLSKWVNQTPVKAGLLFFNFSSFYFRV